MGVADEPSLIGRRKCPNPTYAWVSELLLGKDSGLGLLTQTDETMRWNH